MFENNEKGLVDLINAIAEHYAILKTINALKDRENILKLIENKDEEVYKALYDYILLYESFSFVRTDKMLMLKARDIWKMELERMEEDMKKTGEEIKRLLHAKGMKV